MEQTLREAREKQIETIITLHDLRISYLKEGQLSLVEKKLDTIYRNILSIIETNWENQGEIDFNITPREIISDETPENPYGEFKSLCTLYPYDNPLTLELMKLYHAIKNNDDDLTSKRLLIKISSAINFLLREVDCQLADKEREYVKNAKEKEWYLCLFENPTSKKDDKLQLFEDTLREIENGNLDYQRDGSYINYVIKLSSKYHCAPDISIVRDLIKENRNGALFELRLANINLQYDETTLSTLAKTVIDIQLSSLENNLDSHTDELLLKILISLINFLGIKDACYYFIDYFITLPNADEMKDQLLKRFETAFAGYDLYMYFSVIENFKKTYEELKKEYMQSKKNLMLVLKAIKNQKNDNSQK